MMKPFDIEKAKAGAEVVTRDGREARILAFDFVSSDGQPIIAAIYDGTIETISQHKTNGAFYTMARESNQDLMMAPVKVVKWIRVNDQGNGPYVVAKMFDSEQEAREAYPAATMVAIAPVEWEE